MPDVLKLDPDDTRPHYLQVADVFRAEILGGRLKSGDKLPSHGDVATEFGVSIGTVKRAFSLLQTDGLIVTRQGQGAYVRTHRPVSEDAESRSVSEIEKTLADVVRRLDRVEREVRAIRGQMSS